MYVYIQHFLLVSSVAVVFYMADNGTDKPSPRVTALTPRLNNRRNRIYESVRKKLSPNTDKKREKIPPKPKSAPSIRTRLSPFSSIPRKFSPAPPRVYVRSDVAPYHDVAVPVYPCPFDLVKRSPLPKNRNLWKQTKNYGKTIRDSIFGLSRDRAKVKLKFISFFSKIRSQVCQNIVQFHVGFGYSVNFTRINTDPHIV